MEDDESKILDYPEAADPYGGKSRYDRIFQSVMLISFAGFIIGWLFKLQHWLHSGAILIISLSALALSGALRYILRKPSIENYLLTIIYTILPVAFLFQLMHWPGNTFLLIGGGAAFLIYLILFAYKASKA